MKMTDADERAFAVLDAVSADIEQQGGRPDSMNVREHEQIKQAIEHLRARLAADQQKGGGEVVYQVKLSGPIDAWADTTESQFSLAEDHEKRRRKLYTTPQPSMAAPKPEAQAAWKVLQIGNYGAAYDLPNARRAFTYEHQPGNVLASRLGSAATAAVAASAGDSIDRGLSLLKSLQDEGFGVFQVDVAALSTPASHDAQQPACDCENPEPASGAALVSMECPIHNDNPKQPAVAGDGGLSRSLKLAAAEEQAEGWHAVCGLLSELSPGWAIGPGSGQERALAVIRAALTPAATPGEPEEYEFEVFQGGAWQAGGSAPDFTTAQAEANHYAMMYGQDGPDVEVKFYARREVTPAQKEGNGNG